MKKLIILMIMILMVSNIFCEELTGLYRNVIKGEFAYFDDNKGIFYLIKKPPLNENEAIKCEYNKEKSDITKIKTYNIKNSILYFFITDDVITLMMGDVEGLNKEYGYGAIWEKVKFK